MGSRGKKVLCGPSPFSVIPTLYRLSSSLLIKQNMAPMLPNLGHALVLMLLNMLAIFHRVVHFLLLERLSSLGSWEVTLTSLPVSLVTPFKSFVGSSSSSQPPNVGVLQNSVPDLYSLLTSP